LYQLTQTNAPASITNDATANVTFSRSASQAIYGLNNRTIGGLKILGTTGGKTLTVAGKLEEPVEQLYELNQSWLPRYMASND